MATLRLAESFSGTAWCEIDTDALDRLITVRGRNVIVNAGRVGGGGQRIIQTFPDVPSSVAVPTAPASRVQMSAHRDGWDGFDGVIELLPPSMRV